MDSTGAERRARKDGPESSSEGSLLTQPSFSSTADSSLFLDSCECNEEGCTDCDYGYYGKMLKSWSEKKEYARKEKRLTPLFLLFPREKNARSLKTGEVPKKPSAKSKSELLKDYCPYSSDNCGCSSGCTDCDYGLYTYTVKNKSKLKSKVKNLYVRSPNGFRPLKTSEKSRRTTKPFSAMNILRRKKARSPKIEKILESCYPESSGSCDCKSGYIKHDFEPNTTKYGTLKTEKKTSARTSRKLKTRRIVRSLKLISSKKVSKNAKIFEKDLLKNWFPDSSNNRDCNSDCDTNITTKKKKLKNRSERVRASMNSKILELSSVIGESNKNKKDSNKPAGIFSERRLSWSSCDYSESDSYFIGEDCCNNKYENIRQSRRTKT